MIAMTMQAALETVQMNEGLSGRELEASVLTKAAEILEDAKGNWHNDDSHAYLDEALKYNQRLWTLFQAEMVEDESRIPAGIRQNILSLSTFVDQRTFEVMAYPAPEKLDILIQINRNLAEGLLAQ